jgi:AcrR family transcriptional regulator
MNNVSDDDSTFTLRAFVRCEAVVSSGLLPMASSFPRRRTVKAAPARRVRDDARALYRKAILDAAEDVFSERGVAAARVQDIAARARLAVGTIYNHFEQKEDVLFALLSERTIGFLEAFRAADDDPPSFGDRLCARVVRLLEYTASHRAFFQLASDHGLFGGATASAEALLGGKKLPHAGRYEEAVLALVDEGLTEGTLAPAPRDLLAFQLRNTVRSASQWTKLHHDVSAERAARASVDLFLYGAAKRQQRVGDRVRSRKSERAG